MSNFYGSFLTLILYMSGAFRLFGLCGAVEIMTFELTIMLLAAIK